MKSVSVRNYKSISNSGKIDIKPITVLVGKNSAGKSSFIRLFPLLKQTLEKKVDGSLLWYGDYVDFGDFLTTKMKNANDNVIEMTFNFDVYPRYSLFDLNDKEKPVDATVTFKINETNIEEYTILLFDQKIVLKVDKKNFVELKINDEKIELDGKCIAQRMNNDILPTLITESEKNRFVFGYAEVFKKIYEEVETLLELRNKRIHGLRGIDFEFLMFNSKKDILDFLKRNNKSKFSNLKVDSPNFIHINNLMMAISLQNIFDSINYSFKREFLSISYMKPIRAAVNRYYRIQGISVNEVDSDGSNLPMLLKNMSEKQLSSFEKWSKEKFGVIFSIDTKINGHLSLVIRNEVNSEECTNVADAGYGYSQMLPIVVLLWNIHNNKNNKILGTSKTIIIEQPELHLHPAFQAKMIDVFVNIIAECKKKGIELKIIFETHSETMINRLGSLIYSNKISKDDVNVLVFDKENGNSKILKTDFDSDGLLTNWPIDFFGIGE